MKRLRVYRIDCKKIKFPNPPDIGAYGGRVTEGDVDVDGHSIFLRTLINQTQGLSADVIDVDWDPGL